MKSCRVIKDNKIRLTHFLKDLIIQLLFVGWKVSNSELLQLNFKIYV